MPNKKASPKKKAAVKKMKSHKEIERKFLLKRLPKEVFKKFKVEKIAITQFYFFIDGIWQRYRIAKVAGKKTKYIHTIKSEIGLGTNDEAERNVSQKEFLSKRKKYNKNYAVISKTRHVIKYKGLKFEIDVFKDMTLIMMEVELPSLGHHIDFPPGLMDEVITEVTGMKQFNNAKLAKKVQK